MLNFGRELSHQLCFSRQILLTELLKHPGLDQLSGLAVYRMSYVPVGAVRQFAAGHRHKVPAFPLDNAQVVDDEFVVDRDACKCLYLIHLHRPDRDSSDLHGSPPLPDR